MTDSGLCALQLTAHGTVYSDMTQQKKLWLHQLNKAHKHIMPLQKRQKNKRLPGTNPKQPPLCIVSKEKFTMQCSYRATGLH